MLSCCKPLGIVRVLTGRECCTMLKLAYFTTSGDAGLCIAECNHSSLLLLHQVRVKAVVDILLFNMLFYSTY